MRIARLLPPALLLILAASGMAQSWSRAYDDGLATARKNDWQAARTAFQHAAASRAGDISGATNLPGPPTERRQWRNGAPYSPNFLAAYSLYRVARSETGDAAKQDLTNAGSEFLGLISKGQRSAEAYYFLNLIYENLGNTAAKSALAADLTANQGKALWKVDNEVVAPEDLAAIYGAATPAVAGSAGATTIKAGDVVPTPATTALGPVPILPTKFALVVGNSKKVSFAATDAKRVADALVSYAGYDAANIQTLSDASAADIQHGAEDLAKRMPEGGTILIYFAGSATNEDGKDLLAGNDGQAVAKSEIFRLFMAKGARIFAFFQVDRPGSDNQFFGSEVPMVGAIAQSQATLPGDTVASIVVDGKPVGVYTSAFIGVLQDLRSNQIPILEFGWQVFYKVRRGNTGTTGGGSRQTPTLPVLTNLASDARF